MRYPAAADRPVEMVCEQFTPVIPHNYRESSYPLGLFVWHLHNTAERSATVSLMFSFTNMTGWFADFGDGKPARRNAGNRNWLFSSGLEDGCCMRGVLMGSEPNGVPLGEGDGQMCIAALGNERCNVTCQAGFDPGGDGADVWTSFADTGTLPDSTESPVCVPQQAVAGAVCVQATLGPGERLDVPFVLVWDLPVIEFGRGRQHLRRYTRFFGSQGTHAIQMASEALSAWETWSVAVDSWHADVTAQGRWPDWLYGMMLNEAYLLVDGLTVWTDGTREAPGEESFFAIIECPDYPYYCTLDLWIYGSFLLVMYWPLLERNVIERFAQFIGVEDTFCRRSPHTGRLFPSKAAGAAPHDFGEPQEDPPAICNSYVHQNSNHWKDLNCQFVLTVWRDVVALDDDDLLERCWPAVKQAIGYLARFDEDGDGIIENDGSPDQTMDNIPMKGVSSYCGGLWLAALRGAVSMAERAGDTEFADTWRGQAERARETFDNLLWTENRYLLDTDGPFSDALFIDALFGIWYAALCGDRSLLPEEHMRAHLRTAFETNVQAFHEGRFGGKNIAGADEVDRTGVTTFNTAGCQIEEVLTGLNMSFAGQLIAWGMTEEGLAVLRSLHTQIYDRYGLWFRTPAAYTADGNFRAIMNLRPLIIWALEFQ
jgi:non-lysosomal glucosylceramidase